jgi:hypothetical protein
MQSNECTRHHFPRLVEAAHFFNDLFEDFDHAGSLAQAESPWKPADGGLACC